MTDPAAPVLPSGAAVEAQARGAVKDTVSGLENFLEVFFDLFVPIIAAVIGLVIGPMLFTGQCISDGISTIPSVSSTGVSGAGVFAVGHLAGAGIVGAGAAAAWHFQAGRTGLGYWIARTGAGFAAGWAIGILIGTAIGISTEQTGSGPGTLGILDVWVDEIIGKLSSSAHNLVSQHTPILLHPSIGGG